jgi:hypothetical protein
MAKYQVWHAPKLLDRLKGDYEVQTSEEQGVEARSLVCTTLGVKGMPVLRDGTRKKDKHLITRMDLHKPNKESINA